LGALRSGARLFLDTCAEPEVERIILLDAPAVLGWEAWRDLAGRYGLGLVQIALQSAMDAGAIVPQPVVPLAHVLIGALNECALYVASTEDPAAAREQCAAIFDQILRGITASHLPGACPGRNLHLAGAVACVTARVQLKAATRLRQNRPFRAAQPRQTRHRHAAHTRRYVRFGALAVLEPAQRRRGRGRSRG
jgi:hypothetical protein